MYFGTKSYLKSNHYHTPKHPQPFSFFLGSRIRYSNFLTTAGGDTHTGGFLRSCDNAWQEFHGHTIFIGTDGKSKIISQVDSGPGERLINYQRVRELINKTTKDSIAVI
jgi:hypothetical protein